MTRPVDKATFLDAVVCRARGWYAHRAPKEEIGHGLAWRFWTGQEVERLATRWLGEGISLPRAPLEEAVTRTREALDQPSSDWRFQASFLVDGLVTRADALRREATGGFELVEIKSGKSPEGGKGPGKDLVDDVGFTTMVAQRAGVDVRRVALVLMDRDYGEGAGTSLWARVDVTEAALQRATEFAAMANAIVRDVTAAERPPAELILPCRSCDHFATECVGVGIPDPLFVIPRLSEQKLAALRPYGRVSQIPPEAELTAIQQRVADAYRSGEPIVDTAELAKLEQVVWPVHYLDFETVMPGIPWFAGTGPYASVPSQYSLHIRDSGASPTRHQEYLAPHDTDWRRELTERLVEALGSTGSILVYSRYERDQLRGLMGLFPNLSGPLQRVIGRLFDLEPIIKNGYTHPGFLGRTSIKNVLPVMAPDLSYQGLAVSGGDDALGLFSLMRVGRIPHDEIPARRGELLTYCKLDTLAMVRVHEELLAALASVR
jgi:hypothetical protein